MLEPKRAYLIISPEIIPTQKAKAKLLRLFRQVLGDEATLTLRLVRDHGGCIGNDKYRLDMASALLPDVCGTLPTELVPTFTSGPDGGPVFLAWI